jgi:hypothetical protein
MEVANASEVLSELSNTIIELRDISRDHSTTEIGSLQNLVHLARGWAKAATESFQRRNAIIRQKYIIT